MKNLIYFREIQELFSNHKKVEVINILNGQKIETRNVNPAGYEAWKESTTITHQAAILIKMIQGRENAYRYSHFSDPVKIKALDRLNINCQMLATFRTLPQQHKYIIRVLLPDLQTVAPRNEKFKTWPILLQILEHNRQISEGQYSIFELEKEQL